jgi:hypothetical protein
MERLLTSLVNTQLRRFIKSAGEAGRDFRVSLSGGKASLHNLELDLSSLVHGLPISVSRAFARQLTISIPWTALSTQPIQVMISTAVRWTHIRPCLSQPHGGYCLQIRPWQIRQYCQWCCAQPAFILAVLCVLCLHALCLTKMCPM